jgi:hypothetical protein
MQTHPQDAELPWTCCLVQPKRYRLPAAQHKLLVRTNRDDGSISASRPAAFPFPTAL